MYKWQELQGHLPRFLGADPAVQYQHNRGTSWQINYALQQRAGRLVSAAGTLNQFLSPSSSIWCNRLTNKLKWLLLIVFLLHCCSDASTWTANLNVFLLRFEKLLNRWKISFCVLYHMKHTCTVQDLITVEIWCKHSYDSEVDLCTDLCIYRYNLLQLHQPSRALRSSTQQLLQVPYMCIDFGQSVLSYSSLATWNST